MRPIKFRAYCNIECYKLTKDWYEAKHILCDVSMLNPIKWTLRVNYKDYEWKNKSCDLFISDVKLTQSTWLFDKNWKEIFEGYIIVFWSPNIKQIVEFRKWQYMAKQIGTYWSYIWLWYCDWEKESEIIWNIYENENLLH